MSKPIPRLDDTVRILRSPTLAGKPLPEWGEPGEVGEVIDTDGVSVLVKGVGRAGRHTFWHAIEDVEVVDAGKTAPTPSPAETPITLHIPVTFNLPRRRLADLLVSAFEGGSNYWLQDVDYPVKDVTFKGKSVPTKTRPEGCALIVDEGEDTPTFYRQYDVCLNEGGEMTLTVPSPEEGEETKDVVVNLTALQKGLEIMAVKYPRHFADVVRENDDGTTGDVFLQCVVYGEVVFG